MKLTSKKLLIPIMIILIAAFISLFFFLKKSHKNSVLSPTLTKEQKHKIREIEIPIFRYEQTLFSLDTHHLAKGIEKLYGQYPENLIAKDCWKNPSMMANLKAYLTDPTIRALYDEVQKQYSTMDDVTREIVDAFKIYLTHFPNDSIPQIFTLIPGMDFQMPSVFIYNNDLFINLDMYLGSDFKYYAYAGMPKFISERCQRSFIATDCFTKALVYKHLPDKTLLTGLDNMIYEGKKLFFTQTMFPHKQEQEIIGYSTEKYKWIQQYQSQVWQYLIEKEMLFSKDDETIRRLVDETPFTRDFGNKSPGRLGAYIGWQIVKNYMKNNPNTTLEDLMNNTDAQKILKESYYKP